MPTRRLRTPALGMCWQNQTGLLHHRPTSPSPSAILMGTDCICGTAAQAPGPRPHPQFLSGHGQGTGHEGARPSGLSDALGGSRDTGRQAH